MTYQKAYNEIMSHITLSAPAQERIRQALEQELEQVAQYKEKVAALRCNIQATLAALGCQVIEGQWK